jgi:hypothetical protein
MLIDGIYVNKRRHDIITNINGPTAFESLTIFTPETADATKRFAP